MNEKKQELNFENALERLEKIVRALETGNISLEETIEKFEEGIRLLNFCQNKLTKAEERISVLIEVNEEDIRLEPWNHKEKSNDY